MAGDGAGPAFERIAREIRDQVHAGALVPGDRAPSESELRERYGVAKATANRATALLKSWGLVETVVGAGTRIAHPRVGVVASGPSEHSERLACGLPIYAPGETSSIYEAGVITTENVSADVLNAVGLPVPSPTLVAETTTIVKRARVMLKDDQVTGVCCTWFNHPLLVQQGPAGDRVIERLISTERIPGGTAPVVAELFGKDLTHYATRAGLRPAPVSVARELRVDPGAPLLWLLETRYADDYPVEVDEWFRLGDVVVR